MGEEGDTQMSDTQVPNMEDKEKDEDPFKEGEKVGFEVELVMNEVDNMEEIQELEGLLEIPQLVKQGGEEEEDKVNVNVEKQEEDGGDDQIKGFLPPQIPPQPVERVKEGVENKEEIEAEQVENPQVEEEKEEGANVNVKQQEGQDERENLNVKQQQLVKEGDNEEMEAPPPGWDSLPPPQLPLQQDFPLSHVLFTKVEEEQVNEEVENKEEIEGEQVENPEVEVEKEERVNVNVKQHEGERKDERENLIQQLVNEQGEDEEMEGPPPGLDSLPPPPQLPPQHVEQVKEGVENKEEMEGEQVETHVVEEKEERVNVNVKQQGEGEEEREDLNFKHQQLVKEDGDDDEMEGPPPGWDSLPPPPPQLPPQKVQLTIERGGEKEERENLNVKQQSALKEGDDEEMECPPSGWDSLPPPPPQFPPEQEMGQMVCGSCRRLLSYPQGSKHVRCSCCLTVNYVLEEHQVGQVKCGNCEVLLMYPFGAQSVRCCSCCSLISIGDHNRRPPLSVQQSRACRPFSIGH